MARATKASPVAIEDLIEDSSSRTTAENGTAYFQVKNTYGCILHSIRKRSRERQKMKLKLVFATRILSAGF